jgi:hypothetical protein
MAACPPPDSDLSTLVHLKYGDKRIKKDLDILRNSLVVYKACWDDGNAQYERYAINYNDLDFYVTRTFANSKGIDTDPSEPPSPQRGGPHGGPQGGRRRTRRRRIVSRHK